jgi:hypothetical protein
MAKHGTIENLTFNNLSNTCGYQMSCPDGYGGFNYESDFLFMNRSTWTAPDGAGYLNHWCDTGYQNVCHGGGIGWVYEYGIMESERPNESFSLESLLAAAS